jgi:hypothetical protein
MRRGLKSNTSIGSTAPANSAKSVDSPMSRNRGKIWENRLDLGNSETVSHPLRATSSSNYCRTESAVSFSREECFCIWSSEFAHDFARLSRT